MFEYPEILLHDCILSNIEIANSVLTLKFDDGIFIFDEEKQTYLKRTKCKIELCINGLNHNDAYMFVKIEKFHKQRKSEIKFEDLSKEIKEQGFRIYTDFYSRGLQAILLKGSLNKKEIEITVTDIDSIKVLSV